MGSSTRLNSVQDLMEEILQIQRESAKEVTVLEKVHDIIRKSSKLVEKSESTTEILIDAKILHAGSQVLNSGITTFDTNLSSFNEEEYTKGILNYIRNEASGQELGRKSWKCLAPLTYSIFYKSQPHMSMHGALSLEPLPEKEKGKKEKVKKVPVAKTKLAILSDDTETDKEEAEENIYEHILKSLMRCYKKNNKNPIPFIDFVIDPGSYWHSVENMFYFSFLVRDGRVNMFLNDERLPVVEPVFKNEPPDKSSKQKSNQFSFTLSVKDWRECIKKFDISSAKIKNYQKS